MKKKMCIRDSVDLALRDAPVRHRREHGGNVVLVVTRDEHIVSCEHRQHRGLAVRVLLHRVHREVVRDHDAVEAQRLPQYLMHGGGEGRRQRSVHALRHVVAHEHERRARFHARPERQEVALLERLIRPLVDGDARVRVGVVPIAGDCLLYTSRCV